MKPDEQRKPSGNISVRPSPRGVETVYYKGAAIFNANNFKRWEVHPNGNVLMLAQLLGDAAVKKSANVEYTEGQAIDPIGVWVFTAGQLRRITAPNSSVISAKFSPNGTKLAISENIQNEKHQNVQSRVRIVDLVSGRNLPVGGNLSSESPVSIGEWLSESRIRIFVTGEIFLEQAITYEIPAF